MSPHTTPRLRSLPTALNVALLVACLLPATAWCEDPIGTVTEVRGSAVSTNSAGSERVLRQNDAVRAGDRIVTRAGSQVGLLLGTYYAGLDETTELAIVGLEDGGAPSVKLIKGHVRLIDGDGAGGAVLDTPGLRIADAGADAEGFAFGEKSWLVSMGCARGAAGSAERLMDGRPTGERLAAPSGDCIVSKPGEGLYTANATHDPLPLLTGTPPRAADGLAGDPRGRFGDPLPPVAFGLPGVTPPISTAPPTLLATAGPLAAPRLPCDVGGGCGTAPMPMPTPPPIAPPLNPPVPGLPPGGPVPPLNPPVPGLPPGVP